MTDTKMLSDKYVYLLLVSFIGIFVFAVVTIFLSDTVKKQNWQLLITIFFLLVSGIVISKIQIWRLDRIQCARGEHDPDKLRICRNCHKHLEGSEDLIAQNNRDLERNLNKKGGTLRILGPGIAITVGMLIIAVWIYTGSSHDIIEAEKAINGTEFNVCLGLVKQQKFSEANGFFLPQELKDTMNKKYQEFDCAHKQIMDDLNMTCPIGVVPSMHGWDGRFLCKANEDKLP